MINETEYNTLKYDVSVGSITEGDFRWKRYKELKIKFEKEKKEEEKKIKEAKEEEKIRVKKREEFLKLKKNLFRNNTLKEISYSTDIYYLYDYNSKYLHIDENTIPNPLKNEITDFIINIKKLNPNAIDKIVQTLNQELTNLDKFTICIVPPSDKINTTSGIKQIAKDLSQNGSIDGTECIKRKDSVPSQHKALGLSNRSSTQKLKFSLIIEKKDLIMGKNILLLDDIVTTGNSIKSSKQLLLETGAKSVICILLAKTVSNAEWKENYYY